MSGRYNRRAGAIGNRRDDGKEGGDKDGGEFHDGRKKGGFRYNTVRSAKVARVMPHSHLRCILITKTILRNRWLSVTF